VKEEGGDATDPRRSNGMKRGRRGTRKEEDATGVAQNQKKEREKSCPQQPSKSGRE